MQRKRDDARAASAGAAKRPQVAEIQLKIRPFGPTVEEVEALTPRLKSDPAIRRYLAKTRNRLLRIALVDPIEETKPARPRAPQHFRATFFDYTNNRAVIASGSLRAREKLIVTESGTQPRPNQEEFDEAAALALAHPELAPLVREHELRPYRPMPPLILEEQADGSIERIIAVGLRPRVGMRGHEIVGVNMIRQTVLRYAPSERGRAPRTSAAHNPICGQPDANQNTASSKAGSVWVTVTQGGTTVWKFLLVRPAASSGTNGSGVELRYVDYRGKRLLYRAHVPILNVKYDANACGPYRDWQDQEGMIQAKGTDVAPGIRLCSTPATTILDSGSDTGNFLGVAIYVQGQEVVVVSEMEAGWYRYVSMWRLHTDGTIRPRFGFAGVQSSCVCNIHHHHAYWRLDFDIRTPSNNIVREFNDPILVGNSHWHEKNYEIRRPRDPARKRMWRVENKSTHEAYDIVPGASDGVATAQPDWPFARGDVWILRYRGSEIDDGVSAVGPPYEAGIDNWINGEPISGADVVIWYGAHFTHNISGEEPGHFGHIVGPDLKRVKW
jgi:hypothetical protein